VIYFSILGFVNISSILKATNCPKVVNGDDGDLRAELPSWFRAELIVGGGWGKGVRISVVEIWYRVGCNRVTCFNRDHGNWRNSAHLSKIWKSLQHRLHT